MAPQSPPLVRDQLSTAAVRCRHAASAPSVLDGVVCSQQLETPPNAATGGENGHVVGRARNADGPSPPSLSLLPASVESRAVLSYPRLGANFGRRSLESPTSRAGSALLTVPPRRKGNRRRNLRWTARTRAARGSLMIRDGCVTHRYSHRPLARSSGAYALAAADACAFSSAWRHGVVNI